MVKIWKVLSKRFSSGKQRIHGRSRGMIAVRHRGGGLKRKYRFIEYFRQKWLGVCLYVLRIEYDPNRTAHIALCSILKYGIFFYIIAPAKLKVGVFINTSLIKGAHIGDSTLVKNIGSGVYVNNLELTVGSGSKLSRAAGTGSIIVKEFDMNYSLFKLSSKEHRLISKECFVTLGSVSNWKYKLLKYTKASENRRKGIRPTVRGLAMNPVDHPHGGRTNGGVTCRTYSGKIGLSKSTRKKRKFSNNFIIIGQRKYKLTQE
uniref:Ribosomal protein L2 n=1 Tax=Cavenderia fasciculata TaxID=261658 RepID=B2XX93_CACFS|nr:ribosomal protein L2 [Cavenderia fasciculata]ABX45215.1 ribosomal protein L2 [Cavenderia fasciculata]